MSMFAVLTEDGNYELTSAGLGLIVVIMLLVYLVGMFILFKGKRIGIRQLTFSAMAIALATVTSNIRLFRMPMGGSVTLLSMLFIVLIGNWYGLAMGLCCGVAYGFLQIIMGGYIISIPQAATDYILAFAALGLSGIFHRNKKSGLIIGYIFAVICRCFFSVLSGVIFFAEYAYSDELPEILRGKPMLYSLAYNGGFMGAEAVITVIVIMIPAVSAALGSVKKMALEGVDRKKETKKDK